MDAGTYDQNRMISELKEDRVKADRGSGKISRYFSHIGAARELGYTKELKARLVELPE